MQDILKSQAEAIASAYPLPARVRDRVVSRWLAEIERSNSFSLARREAFKGLPIWAAILLNILIRQVVKALEEWWNERKTT